MNAYFEFANLAGNAKNIRETFHFSWRNEKGESGNYGLNNGFASDAFLSLIHIVFNFQDNPDVIIECRRYQMSQEQMEFLFTHDLDNLVFLNAIIPTGRPLYQLNLAEFATKEAAIEKLKEMFS